MNIAKRMILTGLMALPLLTVGFTVAMSPSVNAIDTDGKCQETDVNIVEGVDCAKGKGSQEELFAGDGSLFKTITNVLLFLIGAVSVIMLIIGGFRYVLSNGDSTQVTNAKNTIFYAVIGIVVALLAYAIVNFIVSSFIA